MNEFNFKIEKKLKNEIKLQQTLQDWIKSKKISS